MRSRISLHAVVMQSPGSGHRIAIDALWALMDTCPTLVSLMTRASHNLATQVSFTALSNAAHQIRERFAWWLLMCHDRVATDNPRVHLAHNWRCAD